MGVGEYSGTMLWAKLPCSNLGSMRCGRSGSNNIFRSMIMLYGRKRLCKKNDVNARSLCSWTANEHTYLSTSMLMAQSMFAAIKLDLEGLKATNTGTTKVNIVSTETCTASFSDATVLTLSIQSTQRVSTSHEDLEQLHDDDGKHEVLFLRNLLSERSVGHNEYRWDLLRDPQLEKCKQEKGRGLEEFKEPEVNEYGPRDSSLKPTIGCDKESDNSKENIDDSLEQHQMTNTETSSVKSSLKVDKDWKEKFLYPANHIREVERKKVRENNDAPIIKDWVSDDEDDDEPNPKVEKKTVIPTTTKKEFVKPEKIVRRSVRHALSCGSFDPFNTTVPTNRGKEYESTLKRFENDQTCVACLKGKQHRASCKTKAFNPITKPLFMLHMDLFGPTFVSSLMHKKYCLVVTDDYSRFSWVFFLTTKDETSEILKFFIKEVENLVDKKVKIIRSDNGTEFKNKVMDDFCREKGIKREYSVARTPQQNGVAERKNRNIFEADLEQC
ncbi:putative ribonuclease H-like domain-containing protein [Tanacetum coccineum]|uniref:Ribonuclease H-like domain-containing protein n=1 Tax=Tanacetum coccineum TaxID=301880 RepID=A0ABQ5GT92_9ASTR